MAHPGSVTGTNIPDGGDPHQTSDEQHSEYLDALEVHRHTGGPGDYNPIQAAGLAIDDDVPWNTNGITGLTYLVLTTIDPATMPVNSIGKDASGNLYWRPPVGSAAQITLGSAVNTSSGAGWVGLSTPARATYSPADGFYEVYEDFGNTLRGRFASAGLRLRERVNSPSRYCDIILPSGWDAAASASPEVNVPPEAIVTEIDGGSGVVTPGAELGVTGQGTWTPTVTGGMASGPNYLQQQGTWFRVGSLVIAKFRIQWDTGGAAFSPLTIGPFPFAQSATWHSISAVTTGFDGLGQDMATGVPCFLTLAGAPADDVQFLDITGTPINGAATGHYTGTLYYFT